MNNKTHNEATARPSDRLPLLTLSNERGRNGWFQIQCDSDIPGIKATCLLASYKPHAERIIREHNEHAALVAVAEAARLALADESTAAPVADKLHATLAHLTSIQKDQA